MRTPPVVLRAQEAARALGFTLSTTDEDGALLHVLAARRGVERVGEIGTGTGVGTAWLASALAPGTQLVTCDVDPGRVAVARAVFADDPDVRVLEGDWRAVLPPEAPFDLLFCDGGHAKDDPDAVLGLVAPRGTVVLDDFFLIPPDEPDPRRDGWLHHPEVVATQVWTARDRRALVVVRAS